MMMEIFVQRNASTNDNECGNPAGKTLSKTVLSPLITNTYEVINARWNKQPKVNYRYEVPISGARRVINGEEIRAKYPITDS